MQNWMSFKFGSFDVIHPKAYSQFINEIFILDVYRTSLLKRGDNVLDLGAATGDFCIIASRKVGPEGKIIAVEPNIEDYKILKLNIEKNRCYNIVPVNLGVGGVSSEVGMTFWGQKYSCKIETLENILHTLEVKDHLNFIKMDIEGWETEVTKKSINIIKNCPVISLEFHDTKAEMDQLILPYGYTFEPITMGYIYQRVIRSFFIHPIPLYKSIRSYLKDSRFQLKKIITGLDMTRSSLMTGTYLRR
jgi:FkbM family methyltransferase